MALSSKFLTDLLAYVPADQRASVEAALEAAPEAVKFAEDGAKRQSDYSRAMDKIRADEQKINDFHAQQQAWYDENKRYLEAGRQALEAGDVPTTPTTPQLPADVLRKDDVERMLAQREQGAVAFIAATNSLAQRHYQQFGEILDVEALVADPDAFKLGLKGTYEKRYREQLDAHQKAAVDKTIEERVQARLAEERKGFAQRPPYPIAGGDVSPLDALGTSQPDPTQYSVESAADEYLRLAAGRAH
jgi:hypothetical protein